MPVPKCVTLSSTAPADNVCSASAVAAAMARRMVPSVFSVFIRVAPMLVERTRRRQRAEAGTSHGLGGSPLLSSVKEPLDPLRLARPSASSYFRGLGLGALCQAGHLITSPVVFLRL